jgi:fructokinase
VGRESWGSYVDSVAQVSRGLCAQTVSVTPRTVDIENKFMIRPALMVGLGEVLWDILPTGRVLGGAPANFAYMTNVLGDQGIVASSVGNDELGREACHLLQKLGLNTSYLQRDDLHETGIASVTIDGAGQPNFIIKESVAWDFLEWTADWKELSARADVICFGSLAQRSLTSADTIDRFLHSASAKTLRIFDVNLRQSFYNEDVLRKSFQYADIVKLNEQELIQVSFLFHLGAGTAEGIARRLLQACDLKLVCITRADRGSLLVSREQTVEHAGFPVRVADAVGAGDAFTACLAHHYVRGNPLQQISEAANRFASWVATQRGATPPITSSQLQEILNGRAALQ